MVFKQFPAFQNSLIIEYDLENVLEFSNGLWKWEISSKAEPEIYFDDSIELIFINSTPIDISDIPGIHCKGGGCYMILEFFDPDEMNSTILFESDISIQSNDKISNFKINEEGYSITFDTNKENQVLLISIPNNLIANKINVYSSEIGTEPTNEDKLKLSTIEYDNLVKFYVKPNNIGTILITNLDIDVSKIQPSEGGGCLIATAAYGSEMAPQVQFLREIRDNTVLQTQSGTSFMTVFNSFYYTFSPAVADYERENPVFKEAVKVGLTPLLTSLTILNYVEIDTEQEMLGYGIGIIMLNIGMYFVAPAVVIIALKKRIK